LTQDPAPILVTGHLLLQIRTRVLNDQLAGDFHRWHPAFTHQPPSDYMAAAA